MNLQRVMGQQKDKCWCETWRTGSFREEAEKKKKIRFENKDLGKGRQGKHTQAILSALVWTLQCNKDIQQKQNLRVHMIQHYNETY